MKCSEFLKELTDFLDGAIDEHLRSDLEEHLTWCHDCHVVYDTTKMTIEVYKSSKLYELPEELRARLQGAILKRCKQHKKGPESA